MHVSSISRSLLLWICLYITILYYTRDIISAASFHTFARVRKLPLFWAGKCSLLYLLFQDPGMLLFLFSNDDGADVLLRVGLPR